MRTGLATLAVLLLSLGLGCGDGSSGLQLSEAIEELAGPDDEISVTLFLAGDGGAVKVANPRRPDDPIDPVLAELHREVEASAEALGTDRVFAVWLGDNVYEDGLPAPGHPERPEAEAVLRAQLDATDVVQTWIVLGNHDWRDGNADHQIELVADLGESDLELLPGRRCPLPAARDVGDELRLIFLDSEWWLAQPRRTTDHCAAFDRDEVERVTEELHRLIDGAADRLVIVAAHHPLRTAGPHGYRAGGFRPQDITSHRYQTLIGWAEDAFRGHPVFAWAAGHEHSLQVIEGGYGVAFHLVSGAASVEKRSEVRGHPDLEMGISRPGYQRLDVYGSGAVRATMVYADAGSFQRQSVWLKRATGSDG